MISEKEKKPGFTLIEILIVVGIIALLATIILASVSNSKKNARLANAKTAVRSALPIIISCKDSGGIVAVPPPSGNILICNSGYPASFWPPLEAGYLYVGGAGYDTRDCNFAISNPDGPNIICNCISQTCR
jgi:prepilin-type N-terminal cleavage/methylation domain-containing protein